MSYAQTAIVLTIGLQHKEMDDAAKELGLPTPQVMALFNKAVRKMHAALRAGKTREVEAEMPSENKLGRNLNPHEIGLDEDLEDGYVQVFFFLKCGFFWFLFFHLQSSLNTLNRLKNNPNNVRRK
jgi:N-acetyltransferase 10